MRQKVYIADIPIDYGNKDELLDLTAGWLGDAGKSRQIVTLNALMLISAMADPGLHTVIKQADLVTVDGRGILLALKKKGYRNVSQLTGLDLAKSLLSFCVHLGYPVYFYGGMSQVARMLGKKLISNLPGLKISAIRDGYGSKLNQTGIKEEIIQKQPALLLVGIGSPAQEIFLAEILRYLKHTVGIGIGGALDVISGWKRESPLLMREHTLEWLYRMFQDPAKFKRFPDLVKFWYRFLCD